MITEKGILTYDIIEDGLPSGQRTEGTEARPFKEDFLQDVKGVGWGGGLAVEFKRGTS